MKTLLIPVILASSVVLSAGAFANTIVSTSSASSAGMCSNNIDYMYPVTAKNLKQNGQYKVTSPYAPKLYLLHTTQATFIASGTEEQLQVCVGGYDGSKISFNIETDPVTTGTKVK